MSKVQFSFIETQSGIPVIQFYPGKNKTAHYAVIDTGSEMTVFDIGIGKSMKVLEEEIECSVNGLVATKNNHKFVKVELPLAIDGIQRGKAIKLILPTQGYATEMGKIVLTTIDNEEITITSIIGSDVLNNLEAKIDYEKKIVHFAL